MKSIVFVVSLLAPVVSHAEPCLTYRERVKVQGVLTRQAFPGPPNFESIAKGDKRDVNYVLKPVRSLCVSALSHDPDEVDVAAKNIIMLQLVLNQKEYQILKPYLGQTVTLSGNLFGAVSGWHHTPVLLSEVKIAGAP